jgi:hypothetical protein
LILGGPSSSPPSGNKQARHFSRLDYWIVKTDAAGNKEWDRSFGTAFSETIRAVRQTSDRGYVFGGESALIKTDSQGNQQWDKSFGNLDDPFGAYTVEIRNLQETRDGGYTVSGSFDLPNAGVPAFGCIWGSWVAKLEKVVSRSGEVITWKADAGVVPESADDLKSEWKTDQSEVLSIGEARAITLVAAGHQRYYRLRKTGASSDAPTLAFGTLLTWPVNLNQILEFSSSKDGAWEHFPGDHGIIGETHYAVIPQNLRDHYFRTRRVSP